MGKSYFNSVIFYHQVGREENKIAKQFKDNDLIIARLNAFSFAKEIFDKHHDEFINKEHPIEIEMTINFKIGDVKKEYEYGVQFNFI
jgi:hypothetical protein